MSDRFEGAGDSEAVAAVLERLDGLTREQWLQRLNWVPEGLEHQKPFAAAMATEPVCQVEAVAVSPVPDDVAVAHEQGKPLAGSPQRKS